MRERLGVCGFEGLKDGGGAPCDAIAKGKEKQ